MKKFETPEIEITEFAVEDVITESTGGALSENQLPMRPRT